jgi:hypothetical protein
MEKIREAIVETVSQIEEVKSSEVKAMLKIHLKHLLEIERATIAVVVYNDKDEFTLL